MIVYIRRLCIFFFFVTEPVRHHDVDAEKRKLRDVSKSTKIVSKDQERQRILLQAIHLHFNHLICGLHKFLSLATCRA